MSRLLAPLVLSLVAVAPACERASSTPPETDAGAITVRAAKNLRVSVVPWDQSIREAAHLSLSDDALETDLDSYRIFTVIVELKNRPPAAQTPDPLADPDRWEFRLDERGRPAGQVPQHIEVHAVDRFPIPGGGYHYRLAFAVYFSGVAQTKGTGTARFSALRIRPAAPPAEPAVGEKSGQSAENKPHRGLGHRRASLGPALERTGIVARVP